MPKIAWERVKNATSQYHNLRQTAFLAPKSFQALVLLFGLGAPVALWLPRSINDRWSAAPVFGLAIFGVVATLAYFNDLLVQATIALAAIAAASLVACCIMVRDRA